MNIQTNNELVDLTGLDELTTVGNYLLVWQLPKLTSVDGLDKLATVGDLFRIQSNPELTSVEALGAITSVGSFSVATNAKLCQSDVDALLSQVGETGSSSGNKDCT